MSCVGYKRRFRPTVTVRYETVINTQLSSSNQAASALYTVIITLMILRSVLLYARWLGYWLLVAKLSASWVEQTKRDTKLQIFDRGNYGCSTFSILSLMCPKMVFFSPRFFSIFGRKIFPQEGYRYFPTIFRQPKFWRGTISRSPLRDAL